MAYFFYSAVFVFGLVIGSFLNCLIYRLEREEKKTSLKRDFRFLTGRSRCPACGHNLSWLDLIPVFSFLFLRRKCRYCGRKISWQYPLVEIAAAILFTLVFHIWLSGFNGMSALKIWDFFTLFYLLLVFSLLTVIFVCDLKHYIIPDKVLYPLVGIIFFYRFFEILAVEHWNLIGRWSLEFGAFKPLANPVLSAFAASLFFLAIVLATKGQGMGLGDVKLAFFMGLFLGFPDILIALFFAFAIGAVMGIGLIAARRKTLKSEIPFGPFLITGIFIALFWGQAIADWYLSFAF